MKSKTICGLRPMPKLPKKLQGQLRVGTKIELEHTKSKRVARRIASHHIAEFPDYYKRLGKMEKQAKRYWRGRK